MPPCQWAVTVANFHSYPASRPPHELRGSLGGSCERIGRYRPKGEIAVLPPHNSLQQKPSSYPLSSGSNPGPPPSQPSDVPLKVLFSYKARCFTDLRLNMLRFCGLPRVPPLCNRPLWPPFRSSTCTTATRQSARYPKALFRDCNSLRMNPIVFKSHFAHGLFLRSPDPWSRVALRVTSKSSSYYTTAVTCCLDLFS